jgi:galactonate dehydratase
MKIDRIEPFIVGNPWKNWVLVKVSTREGHVGWGEATTGLTTKPVVGAVEEIARLFIGRDAQDLTRNWHDAFKALYLPSDGAVLSAMSGIDTACWDIIGKDLGLPLYRLLGGRAHDRLRVYANGWCARRAEEVAAAGYTAMKFDPLGHSHRVMDWDERRKALALVEAVRAALPDSVDIILEFHDRLTSVEAAGLIADLAQFRPLWVEDPVWSADVPALARVANSSPSRIAQARIDLVLPEYLRLGGLARMRQVAAVAEAHNALVAPHNAQSPLGTAVNAHFDTATPNFFIQECFDDYHVAWTKEVFENVPSQRDGAISVSDRPGHGVTVNEAVLRKYPYGERNFMNLFSKGWETRNQAKKA